MNFSNTFVVALDGGNGAGKTTAINLAKSHLSKLDVPVMAFSSGNLYRAVAVVAELFDVDSLEDVGSINPVRLGYECGLLDLSLNEGQVTFRGVPIREARLRTESVTALAPHISQMEDIRVVLNEIMREAVAAHRGIALVDGRDIGTEVFPDADLKFYLTVSEEESARRQGQELSAVHERNELDRSRSIAPMRAAPGAIVIDTTQLTPDDVVGRMMSEISQRFPLPQPA